MYPVQTRTTVRTSYSAVGGWSLDKKIISIYMGNPDNSNHAELELPATPWEMVDAMDKLRLSEGQKPYWQVEDMGRYEFLAPHLDGYDLYQFNALAEKLRTFSDVDAVAFEGLVQMELNNLYQNNGGDLTLRRVLDLAYSVDCCHVVPGITDDAALGQFYVENDFLPALATVPDSVLEMLDYHHAGQYLLGGLHGTDGSQYDADGGGRGEMRVITMGSLFDGIGGFPLAAIHNGVVPLWASEIEAFPIRVTAERLPGMLHYGDITKLRGDELPPVDIICGGSPCQDYAEKIVIPK